MPAKQIKEKAAKILFIRENPIIHNSNSNIVTVVDEENEHERATEPIELKKHTHATVTP